jgi:hypothetical protein
MATTNNPNGDPNCIYSRGPTKKRCLTAILDRLSHEFVNQLTVINLSCFRIRALSPADSARSVLAEIERIEKAVTEVTKLLASLPTKEDTGDGSQTAMSPSSTGLVQGNHAVPLVKKHRP